MAPPAPALRASLRQGQSLAMTPRLRQALRLLRMTGAELREHVARELEANPVLERWEPAAGGAAAGRGGVEDVAAAGPTLRDHLAGQINVDFRSAPERAVALWLAGMLDDDGRLPADAVGSAAAAFGCGAARVEEVLEKCRRLDPPGAFARSLAECLALQLRARGRLDARFRTLLDNLELLARRDHPKLRRLCGVGEEELLRMARELRGLAPRPGARFGGEAAPPAVPDLLLRRGAGGWRVELNPDAAPRVRVSDGCREMARAGARSRRDAAFLDDRLRSADWLVGALRRRAETILRVGAELVRRQEAFLDRGPAFLEPLTLAEVAEAAGVHESTASRATAGKRVATARGVIELRRFFSAAVGEGDARRAAEAVRFRIRGLIDAEPPGAPVSDDRIAEVLRGEGVAVARRTVAKYRGAMRLPPAARRRREKAPRAPRAEPGGD